MVVVVVLVVVLVVVVLLVPVGFLGGFLRVVCAQRSSSGSSRMFS